MPTCEASPRRVFLIGMMGAGKTTVGRLLAERLGYPYLDSDEHIERTTGRTVREIFESGGEQAFRAEERKALAVATTTAHPAVVGVAGGAVLDPDGRRRLREAGVVVWLRAGVGVLASRVTSGDHRPLLGDDPEASLRRLYQVRRGLYEELADIVVDVDSLQPAEVVDRIVAALP